MKTRALPQNWYPLVSKKQNETAGIPNELFEHDLNLPDDVSKVYSKESMDRERQAIERLKKLQRDK